MRRCLNDIANNLLKYSIAEFTVDEGIAKSINPKIYIKHTLKLNTKAYSLEELREIPIDDGFDDLTVDISQPYTEVCADNQESSKDN